MPGCGMWHDFIGVKNSSWTCVLLISHWWEYVEVLEETRKNLFSVVLLYGQAVHQYSHIVPWLSVSYT